MAPQLRPLDRPDARSRDSRVIGGLTSNSQIGWERGYRYFSADRRRIVMLAFSLFRASSCAWANVGAVPCSP